MKKALIIGSVAAVLCMTTLWGCGGSSSSTTPTAQTSTTTISGVASSGAALTGTVALKDAKGVERTSPIGTAGAFSIVIDGLTAPYMIKAYNSSSALYSYATAAGTVNVNPFTNVCLVNALGVTDLSTYYGSTFQSQTDFSTISSKMNTAINDLKTQLSQSGGLYSKYNLPSTTDFMTGTITIGQAVDKIFDDMKVTINSTTGTVTMNNASGQTFMTMTRGTANGMMTFTINSANYPSVTVTTATCDSGYVGATATTTSINIPANCGTVTYCVNSTNPLSVGGAYYLIGGKKVTVDMTQLMPNGTTVNMTYAQSLGPQIANACVGL